MILLFAAVAAVADSDAKASDPYIDAWAQCVAEYALPRLANEATQSIVDGGLAACTAQEDALHQFYRRDMGPETGEAVYMGVRGKVRDHLIVIVDKAKSMRGIK